MISYVFAPPASYAGIDPSLEAQTHHWHSISKIAEFVPLPVAHSTATNICAANVCTNNDVFAVPSSKTFLLHPLAAHTRLRPEVRHLFLLDPDRRSYTT